MRIETVFKWMVLFMPLNYLILYALLGTFPETTSKILLSISGTNDNLKITIRFVAAIFMTFGIISFCLFIVTKRIRQQKEKKLGLGSFTPEGWLDSYGEKEILFSNNNRRAIYMVIGAIVLFGLMFLFQYAESGGF